VFHTYWVTSLLHRVGFRSRCSAFTIAFLPFIYLLTFAVIVELSESIILTAERHIRGNR